MDKAKRKRLENSGWKVGSAEEFLKLTSAEAELVEMKVALSSRLRKTRVAERPITERPRVTRSNVKQPRQIA